MDDLPLFFPDAVEPRQPGWTRAQVFTVTAVLAGAAAAAAWDTPVTVPLLWPAGTTLATVMLAVWGIRRRPRETSGDRPALVAARIQVPAGYRQVAHRRCSGVGGCGELITDYGSGDPADETGHLESCVRHAREIETRMLPLRGSR